MKILTGPENGIMTGMELYSQNKKEIKNMSW